VPAEPKLELVLGERKAMQAQLKRASPKQRLQLAHAALELMKSAAF